MLRRSFCATVLGLPFVDWLRGKRDSASDALDIETEAAMWRKLTHDFRNFTPPGLNYEGAAITAKEAREVLACRKLPWVPQWIDVTQRLPELNDNWPHYHSRRVLVTDGTHIWTATLSPGLCEIDDWEKLVKQFKCYAPPSLQYESGESFDRLKVKNAAYKILNRRTNRPAWAATYDTKKYKPVLQWSNEDWRVIWNVSHWAELPTKDELPSRR